MRLHRALLLATLPGCIFGSAASGDWDIREFQRFEIDGASFSTTEEEGVLSVDGRNATFDFEFQTDDFGRLEWLLEGEGDNEGGGVYRFVLDGEFQFFDAGDRARILVDGSWNCVIDGRAMDCEGNPMGSKETYRIDLVLEKR
ncbi:MAG: hypothetical protein AAF602_15050 [Myxococcota bacterium]